MSGTSLPQQLKTPTVWPTPAASNPNDGEGLGTWLARRDRVKATAKNGNGMGTPLSIAVQMWPTPTVNGNDNRAGLSAKSGDGLATSVRRSAVPSGDATPPTALNPEWVEWLMGFPIGFTDLEASETPSSPRSPSSSAVA